MASLDEEYVIFTIPRGDALGNNANAFEIENVTTDTIAESTADGGVTIDSVRIREDTITSPAVTVASMTPVGSETNIYIAIVPKGTGALTLAVPDATSAGGDARGDYAIDLQIIRSLATHVASGDNSGVLSGSNNTASGNWSVVTGGDLCDASADYAQASGRRAKAVGTGAYVIADSTNADFTSTTTDQYNARFTNGYRMIGGTFSLNDRVTKYTNGSDSTVGATGTALYTITTPNDSLHIFSYRVVAATSIGETAVYTGSIKAVNSGGTASVGTQFDNYTDIDAALATSTVTFSVYQDLVYVDVFGVAAKTIEWRGELTDITMTF